MVSPEIEKRIVNFLNKSANANELNDLEIWIKDPKNQSILKEYVKTHFVVTLSKSNPDSSVIRSSLLREIRKEKRRAERLSVRSILKYAAILVFIVGAGYFINNEFFRFTNDQVIIPKEEAITLQLEDGSTRIIREDGSVQVTDKNGNIVGKQEGAKLVYDDKSPIEKLVYNTLTVPYGKRFDLVLSDGTQVVLNAGTSLKYPVQFISGRNRDVFLKGEAFFDVAKDAEHPFVVDAGKLTVQVLGTRFNMTTYEEDTHTEVVLVEGSVSLNPDKNPDSKDNVVLKPGSKGFYNKSQGTISITKVNTSIYTAWVNGDVVFRNAPFENIAKRLERLYNVTIINNNQRLANEVFNASFEVDNENINDILHYFNKVYHIEYKIADNTIIID
jgi:ferric-dicitrate binding protein FerR (iron transport regulator)